MSNLRVVIKANMYHPENKHVSRVNPSRDEWSYNLKGLK